MLEAQPLDRVVQLDVDAEIVGVQLQLVARHQPAVLGNVQGQRGHRPVDRQPPVPVLLGLNPELDRNLTGHGVAGGRTLSCR